MTYRCPICEWDPYNTTGSTDPEAFYYILRKRAIPIKDSWVVPKEDKYYKGRLEPNFEKIKELMTLGFHIYPKRANRRTIPSTVMGPGGGMWTEIHFCPKCQKEFKYCNSNF